MTTPLRKFPSDVSCSKSPPIDVDSIGRRMFNSPPWTNFSASPFGAVQKDKITTSTVIDDMSSHVLPNVTPSSVRSSRKKNLEDSISLSIS